MPPRLGSCEWDTLTYMSDTGKLTGPMGERAVDVASDLMTLRGKQDLPSVPLKLQLEFQEGAMKSNRKFCMSSAIMK